MTETTRRQAPKMVDFTITHPKPVWLDGVRHPTGAKISVTQARADEMTKKGLGEVIE